MKRLIVFAIVFFVCFSTLSPTIAFAEYDTKISTVNYSDFQPGSGGLLCLDEDGEEYFISANEILSYDSCIDSSLPPSIPERNIERKVELTDFSDYKPVVFIRSIYSDGHESGGTGCYIGPTGILTCAHVIYDRDRGWPKETYIYTDYKNDTKYGARYKSVNKYIGGEYQENDLDDWGIVTVATPSTRGYYGYKSTSDLYDLLGKDVVVPGYYQYVDGGAFCFVSSKGTIKQDKQRALPYLTFVGEVGPGLSGAPVLDDSYTVGIIIREGKRLSLGGTTTYDVGLFQVINPWLHNTINKYSGR